MLPLTFSANHNRIEHFLSTKNIVLLHVHDIVLHDIYTHTAAMKIAASFYSFEQFRCSNFTYSGAIYEMHTIGIYQDSF